ncbi:MAG: hypothetical protein KY452_12885, partial [Actinobacteria bacterium]|nr:hypothetical protein [Actinomycetota bacterium]
MYAGRTPTSGGHGAEPPPRPGSAGPAFPQSGNGPQSDNGTGPAPLELTLYPDSVTDVDDGAGHWQYERGRVSDHGTQVGIYASTSHLAAAGTGDQDATLTLTVFFL